MKIPRQMLSLLVVFFLFAGVAMAQSRTVTGKVLDPESKEGLPGANVIQKGTVNGTVTDVDGSYALSILEDAEQAILISSVGYMSQEIAIGAQSVIDVELSLDVTQLEEIVVVGYGVQKKESVVGAISQTSGTEIVKQNTVEVANALTGLVPGLVTIQTSGIPGGSGEDDNATQIFIRGQSTWNNSQPLILVDGVERKMEDVDPLEIENISVLKDASATAVFGVQGANGVILITTKRGRESKPVLSFEGQYTMKTVSKLYPLLDSYEGNVLKNYAILNEVGLNEAVWADYKPQEILNYYRTQQYPELYPDINWLDEFTKDFASAYKFNTNVQGGTKFVKYFASMSYLHEGDILASQDFGQGYVPEFKYDRFNFRSNLDFDITRTTKVKVNLAGNYGQQKRPDGDKWNAMKGFNDTPPDMYPIRYSDGTFADYDGFDRHENPISRLNFEGYKSENRSELNTDIELIQQLDMVTKGLSVGARVSFDNYLLTRGPNIGDDGIAEKYILPGILDAAPGEDLDKYEIWKYPGSTTDGYNWVRAPLNYSAENIRDASNSNNADEVNRFRRQLFYQFQINYARTFNKHSVSALALMNRRELANGQDFLTKREDWVSRVTYNYDDRYFLEFNGAYNGSEKFDKKYRFGFFPSGAAGWMFSNEKFFKGISDWWNMGKVRYSYGQSGNDQGIGRWQYVSSWSATNAEWQFGAPYTSSTGYPIWLEGDIANPNIRWETSTKNNLGFESGFFKSALTLTLEYFWEHRTDMLIGTDDRTSNDIFGASLPAANLGEVKTNGWEIDLGYNYTSPSRFNVFARYTHGYAKDEVIDKDDPELRPDYQKLAGYQIGQTRTYINSEMINTWDDLYTGVMGADNTQSLPGDFRQIDFNADGFIDNRDQAPWMYPTRPQYNYSLTLGGEYKGFSASIMFYGVYNVSRNRGFGEFSEFYTIARDIQRDLSWLPEAGRTTTAEYPHVRYSTGSPKGDYWLWDASYLRIKNAQIAYTFDENFLGKSGLANLRVYLQGNNLAFWSQMKDDREGDSDARAYPVMKRFTVGALVGF